MGEDSTADELFGPWTRKIEVHLQGMRQRLDMHEERLAKLEGQKKKQRCQLVTEWIDDPGWARSKRDPGGSYWIKCEKCGMTIRLESTILSMTDLVGYLEEPCRG